MSEHVKIGSDFFAKIKNDYADWRWALVREFLQNCFDAPGCTETSVGLVQSGGVTVLTVSNNGKPMDRATLTDKLLTLGGSGKNFEGENTGGFGVAKSLLYYLHKSYTIHTGTLLVDGTGGVYKLSVTKDDARGTISQITIEGKEAEALASKVRLFASMAQWKGTLRLNGETVATNLHKGARRKDLGWGVIYTNNSATNLCIVRINGQPMFTRYTRYKACVLIELTGKANVVLTSNRDALTAQYDSALSDLLTALAVDKKSALREQRAEYKRYLGEKARNEAKAPKKSNEGLAAFVDVKKLVEEIKGSIVSGTDSVTGESIVATPETAVGGSIRMVVVSKEDAVSTISLGTEFILKNSTGMKTPAYYIPGDTFSSYSRGLVRAWTAVLLKLYQLHDRSGEFSIGFTIDEENEAEYETGVYGSVYYINPVELVTDEKGKRTLQPRYEGAWGDRFRLISTAAHEFVHGAYGLGEHDEDYAGMLSEVMETCLKHSKDLFELCRPVVEESEKRDAPKRIDVFGHSSSSVIRYMGSLGWGFNAAKDIFTALGVTVADGSIRTFLQAGKQGLRGDPAKLTEEQMGQLDELYRKYC